MGAKRWGGVAPVGLAIVGAVMLALAGTFAADREAAALTNCTVSHDALDSEEQAFLGLINAYRAENGLAALTVSTNLNRGSAWMVNDMAANNYFAHTDSAGRSAYQRAIDCGYPQGAGENLAAGSNWSTAQAVMTAWKASAGHNTNMLTGYYRQIGIARYYLAGSQYGWYWATTFGSIDDGTGGGASPPPATAIPTGTATPVPAANTPTQPPAPTATRTQAAPASTPTSSGPAPSPSPTAALATSTPASPGGGSVSITPTAPATSTPTPGNSATDTPTATRTPSATPRTAATATPTAPSSPSLALSPGANLVAWPSGEVPPAQALGNSANSVSVVYKYDAATGEWLRYFPGLPNFLNNLKVMRQGEAYWILARSASKLTVAE